MRFQRKLALFVAAAILFSAAAKGQDKVPVLIFDTVSDGDRVGQQLVFELKEAIRGSFGFRLIEDHNKWPHMKMYVVTVQGMPGSQSATTAASMSFVYDGVDVVSPGLFVSSAVQACGSNRLRECARTMMGNLDAAVSQLREMYPRFAKGLR